MKLFNGILFLSVFLFQLLAYAQTKNVTRTEGFLDNPDGSVTVLTPRILRGSRVYPLAGNAKGVCQLFGFNNYLDGSHSTEDIAVAPVVEIGADGKYKSTSNSPSFVYKELSCYFEDKLKTNIVKSEKITENLDGSVTVFAPRILRGSHVYPLAGDAKGVCQLFGFNNYLDGSHSTEDIAVAPVVEIGADGKYKSTSNYRTFVFKELACYDDGQLKTVVSAGGVIYYMNGNINEKSFENKGIKIIKLK
jgi:hypothetical protein